MAVDIAGKPVPLTVTSYPPLATPDGAVTDDNERV
jgi:hypothetical protein